MTKNVRIANAFINSVPAESTAKNVLNIPFMFLFLMVNNVEPMQASEACKPISDMGFEFIRTPVIQVFVSKPNFRSHRIHGVLTTSYHQR